MSSSWSALQLTFSTGGGAETALAPEKYPKTDPMDPYRKKYDNIEFMGPVKPPKPIPINKPTTAEITEYEEADILFYNVNSIRSAVRQQRISMGIQRKKNLISPYLQKPNITKMTWNSN